MSVTIWGWVASSPLNIGETPFCLNVNALPVSPILPLAMIEIPAPSTFGLAALEVLFKMLYFVPPEVWVGEFELSARRITLPSALIWSTFISLFKLAILINEAFEPLVLVALTVPSTATLTDFVKSLESAPIPVHIPPSQGPTSVPIAPLVTFITKFAPFVVLIWVFLWPEFNILPFVWVIVTLPSEVI